MASTSTSAGGVPSPPPDICVCSRCRLRTYIDKNGVKQPGVRHAAKTIKRHKQNDALKEHKRAIQRDVLGDAVLLATVGVPQSKDVIVECSESEVSTEFTHMYTRPTFSYRMIPQALELALIRTRGTVILKTRCVASSLKRSGCVNRITMYRSTLAS